MTSSDKAFLVLLGFCIVVAFATINKMDEVNQKLAEQQGSIDQVIAMLEERI